MSNTKKIVECDDHYILPIKERIVSRCFLDTALGIQFFDTEPEVTIRIEGNISLFIKDKEIKFKTSDIHNLGKIFDLLRKKIMSAIAFKNGMLEIMFEDETRLSVESDAMYETWEISGNDGLKVVNLPGGGVSIWQPHL